MSFPFSVYFSAVAASFAFAVCDWSSLTEEAGGASEGLGMVPRGRRLGRPTQIWKVTQEETRRRTRVRRKRIWSQLVVNQTYQTCSYTRTSQMEVAILLTQGTTVYSRTTIQSCPVLFTAVCDLFRKVTAMHSVYPTLLLLLLLVIEFTIVWLTSESSSFPAPNQVHTSGARLMPEVNVV